MKTLKTTVLAAAMAAALPVWAGDPLDADLARAGFGVPDAAAVVRTAEQLRAHGVADGPLANKVREGIAKKAPPQAIAGAAAKLGDRMLAAAQLYPGHADPVQKTATVEAAAKVMMAGGRLESVRGIFEKIPSSALGRHEWHRPFDACAALIIAGAGEAPSASIVSAAIERGYSSTELTSLPVRFGRLVSTGQTPQQAAAALFDAVIKEESRGQGQGRGSGGPGGRDGRDDMKGGAGPDSSLLRGSGKSKPKQPPAAPGGGGGGSGGKGGK